MDSPPLDASIQGLYVLKTYPVARDRGMMSERSFVDILTLRFVVGFMGEGGQYGWWPSGFLSASAEPFLIPIFGNSRLVAQYHGVSEAARRVHDERIGLGQVFHLFRLSDSIEVGLFEHLLGDPKKANLANCFDSLVAAESKLTEIGSGTPRIAPGPLRIGGTDDMEAAAGVATLASCYLAAFRTGIQCFPYFSSPR